MKGGPANRGRALRTVRRTTNCVCRETSLRNWESTSSSDRTYGELAADGRAGGSGVVWSLGHKAALAHTYFCSCVKDHGELPASFRPLHFRAAGNLCVCPLNVIEIGGVWCRSWLCDKHIPNGRYFGPLPFCSLLHATHPRRPFARGRGRERNNMSWQRRGWPSKCRRGWDRPPTCRRLKLGACYRIYCTRGRETHCRCYTSCHCVR